MCSTSGGLQDGSGKLRNDAAIVNGRRRAFVPTATWRATLSLSQFNDCSYRSVQFLRQEMMARNMSTLVLFHIVTLPEVTGTMANNKKPDKKQPGENPEGKYHYNPGNMAGKTPGDAEQTDDNRDAPPRHKEKPTG
jgi:hypothetical protein